MITQRLKWKIEPETELSSYVQKKKEEQIHEQYTPNPFQFLEMKRACDRVAKAIEEHEHILIYADYDADGTTSAAILTQTLRFLGAEVSYFTPNRFKHGYGPNSSFFEELKHTDITLVITVDNGVSGKVVFDQLKEHPIDIIVTDHHELPKDKEDYPFVHAVLHPVYSEYTTKELAGCGVSLKFAQGMLMHHTYLSYDANTHQLIFCDASDELKTLVRYITQLAAIGTIADVVPLQKENRHIVQEGLTLLNEDIDMKKETPLTVLCQKKGITTVDTTAVGFVLGPHLNAPGRLYDATIVIDYLCETDEILLEEMVDELVQINDERKKITNDVLESARVHEGSICVCVFESAHEGVLGIVASRLVEQYDRPVLVLTETEHGYKGSGRSIYGVHLVQILREVEAMFVSFGGHAAAAGVTVKKDQLSDFLAFCKDVVYEVESKQEISILCLEGEYTTKDETLLSELEPFGVGNERPYFGYMNGVVTDVKVLKDIHLKWKVHYDAFDISCIAFQAKEWVSKIQEGMHVSVIGRFQLETFQGREQWVLHVDDIETREYTIYDYRRTKQTVHLFEHTHHIILIDDRQSEEEVYSKTAGEAQQNQHIDIQTYTQFIQARNSEQNIQTHESKSMLHLYGVPRKMEFEELKQCLQTTQNIDSITCYFQTDFMYIFDGKVGRDECAKLYVFLKHKTKDSERVHLTDITKEDLEKLGFSKEICTLLLKILKELQLLTVDSGILQLHTTTEKLELMKAPTYKKLQERYAMEEMLYLTSSKELRTLFYPSNIETS